MKPKKVTILGMELEQWQHESCIANIGVGDNWATIYNIKSIDKGKGHATALLIEMQKYYENLGKTFGSTIALSETMEHLLKKLNIDVRN